MILRFLPRRRPFVMVAPRPVVRRRRFRHRLF